MQVYIASQMNGPGQEIALRHDDAAAPGFIAGVDRFAHRLAAIRNAVPCGAIPGNIYIVLKKHGRTDAPKDFRYTVPSRNGAARLQGHRENPATGTCGSQKLPSIDSPRSHAGPGSPKISPACAVEVTSSTEVAFPYILSRRSTCIMRIHPCPNFL